MTGSRRAAAANRRLFRLVAEVLHAIEAGVFHPNPGLGVEGLPVLEPVLGVGITRLAGTHRPIARPS